ncbi:MAG: retroviral-like aspartic protease family protein [Candidatus Obscuribacterales bacterium]|nr:retroviral-like aspartic protease family protein [Candidatus Obscuribacterales bacterium]
MYKVPVKLLLSGCLVLASNYLCLAKEAAKEVNSAFTAGVSFYSQKNYRAAAQKFEESLKQSPQNADAIYYCALSHQQSNNWARAKQLFEYIVQAFPQSRVAGNAQTALSQIAAVNGNGSGSSVPSSQQTFSRSMPGSARQTLDSDLASVPDLVKIPFEKRGNDVTVTVQVNGHSVPFILDTGAYGVAVGQNHLRDWGITPAPSKDQFDVGGVGDGKAKAWEQKLDIKLGPIYRRNFSVTVLDNMPTEPLLGQTFLSSFTVNIDDNTRTVLLAKKSGNAARDIAHKSYTGIEIPFIRQSSGHMQVDVRVNGKPFKMLFDTGCERTSFSSADWQRLGFQIPADAQQGKSRGVLGETTTHYFNIESLKLGKIEQTSAPISVAEGSRDSLLGMSFYGKYKYTIDSARNVIIFEGVDR